MEGNKMKKIGNVLYLITTYFPLLYLGVVFIISFIPFLFPEWHGHIFYTFIGGFFTFFSSLFVNPYSDDSRWEEKPKRIFSIVGLIIIVLGVISIYFIQGKYTGDIYNSLELCASTYFGAMLGLCMGGMFSATISNDRVKRKKEESEYKRRRELKGKRYPLTVNQNAQIDCRVDTCKFYNGAGKCVNISPAITLNPENTFVCWSMEEKNKEDA